MIIILEYPRICKSLEIRKMNNLPEPIRSFILDSLHEACMRQIQVTSTLEPEMQDDVIIVDLLMSPGR
jgi:hypothetical protein